MSAINNRITLLHLITALNRGGAESSLVRLLENIDRSKYDCYVISLTDEGSYGKQIREFGIPLFALNLPAGRVTFSSIIKLIRLFKKIKPDVLQSWMYHANLAALVYRLASRKGKIVWNVRQSIDGLKQDKLLTKVVIYLCAYLSFIPDLIVYNADYSAKQHEKLGYRAQKTKIIQNGFDSQIYKPDSLAYKELRERLKLNLEDILIGMFARFHPMKDYLNLIAAANIICQTHENIYFLLVGREVDGNKLLISKINEYGLIKKFILLPECENINKLAAGLDIMTLSSCYNEGFPNVVGEAMSCGVPCVVTDVGDCRHIVADTGIVVPPKEPQALANGWRQLIGLGHEKRRELGKEARKRIRENFSIDAITKEYEKLYRQIAASIPT